MDRRLEAGARGRNRERFLLVSYQRSCGFIAKGTSKTDIGQQKVVATSYAVRRIDPDVRAETIFDRYRPKHEIGEVLFCCVDSIDARTAI